MKLQRLLVPTDFSEHAGYAFEYANHWAGLTGGRVHVLHSRRPPPRFLRGRKVKMGQDTMTLSEAVDASAQRELQDFLNKTGSVDDASISHSLESGPAYGKVMEFAKASDVVLMGARGYSSPGDALGHLTAKVVRHCPIPVLTVREPFAVVRRILAPVDFSDTSAGALEAALHLGRTIDADVVAAHVIWSSKAYARAFILTGANEDMSFDDWAKDQAKDEMASFLHRHDLSPNDVVFAHGDPAAGLLELANEFDMIVMATRGAGVASRFAFGSVAHGVMREAGCPVLTIRTAVV